MYNSNTYSLWQVFDILVTSCCSVDLLQTASMLLGQLGYTNILHHQHPVINDREQITRLLIITLFYFKIVSFELLNLYTLTWVLIFSTLIFLRFLWYWER